MPHHLLRAVLLLIVAGTCTMLPAQRPGGAARAITGRIYGKVLDAVSRKGAEFATVTLLAAGRDSVITGAMVRGNGDFLLEPVPGGRYRLQVSFLGYRSLEQAVEVTREKPEVDLGDLELEPDAGVLQEATVVREKSTMQMLVDRRVFNVDKDLAARGGSGVDVMKNVPGLSVDLEGNVEMRGARPQVLVDGRPSSLTLEQIPAEEIERVEVITNPSVIFDANSTGGIINVVLKKSTKPGYSGQLQAGVGTNERRQAGGNVNLREGRWGFNLSANYNGSANLTDGLTLRTDLEQGTPTGTFEQGSDERSERRMYGGRFGADLQVSNRSNLSVSQSVRFHDMSGREEQVFESRSGAGELTSYGTQVNGSGSLSRSLTSQLAFRHTGPEEGREWSADLTYNRWDRDSDSRFDLRRYLHDGAPDTTTPQVQDIDGGSYYDQFSFQFDMADPQSTRSKLEYGVKSNLKWDRTWLDVRTTTPQHPEGMLDSALTNNYRITDLINAAYVNWTRTLTERWSLQAGLRFEQTWFETELTGKDQVFSYKYPDGGQDLLKALFPAVYLVRRWPGSMREVQVNFSRKIDRPRFWQIMPFIMFSDARNVRIGNPGLAPEMNNLAEVNHLLPFWKGRASWLTSLFGRYTEDVITGYSTPLATDSTVLLNTFVNGSHSTTAGWENVVKVDPIQGLQITLSGTLQYLDLALASANGGDRNQGLQWSAKVLLNYRLPKDWSVQVNGEYEGPRVQAQGRTLEQYGVDLSVGKDFLRKLSAVLSVNDVFYTRRRGTLLETEHYTQESYRRREMRSVRFTLTWKFGEQNNSLFRRRQPQRENNDGGGMEM